MIGQNIEDLDAVLYLCEGGEPPGVAYIYVNRCETVSDPAISGSWMLGVKILHYTPIH